jgi:CRISPR-associated protein Csh1
VIILELLCLWRGKGIGMKAGDIFKFASFDKPGFAHEMDDKKYYVNMPLCEDCFSKISLGKRVLDADPFIVLLRSKVTYTRRHLSDNELARGEGQRKKRHKENF